MHRRCTAAFYLSCHPCYRTCWRFPLVTMRRLKGWTTSILSFSPTTPPRNSVPSCGLSMLGALLPYHALAALHIFLSSPDEVSKFLAPRVHDAQCRRLLHIATLCHKYDCSDLLAWALEQAQSNCKSRWGVQCIFSPSLPTIACLVQLHARGVSGLAQWAEPCIRLSIEKDRSTLLAVVRMTGLSSWSSLEAYAYYRLVCLGMADSLSLSVTEQTRLLAGYHNLTELWAKISTARLDMAHACPPAFQADCEANCIGLWHDLCTASTTCASSSLVDLVGRMGWINTASTKALKDGGFVAAAVADVPQRLVNSAAACWSNLRCRKAFRAGVKAVADEMERNALYCMGTGAGLIDHASCTLPLAPAPSLSLGRGRASM